MRLSFSHFTLTAHLRVLSRLGFFWLGLVVACPAQAYTPKPTQRFQRPALTHPHRSHTDLPLRRIAPVVPNVRKPKPKIWVAQADTNVRGRTSNCRVNWNARIRIDFQQSQILEVVRWIAKLTCQNFILSDRIRGSQLNIISSTQVSVREAYQAFFAALKANEMTAYRSGAYWKIIYTRDSLRRPVQTYVDPKTTLPNRDEVVTYLHRIQHLDVNQIAGLVRQLASPSGGVIPYQAGSILIITDYATNLRRIRKVLSTLDVPQDSTKDNIYVVQVKYAEAQNIAQKIQQLFEMGPRNPAQPRRQVIRGPRIVRGRRGAVVRAPTPATPQKQQDDLSEDAYRITKMIADERTNQIILLTNARALKRVIKLLKDLDVPLPNDGQIWVHQLKFATAEEMAQTLSQLTQGTQQQRGNRARGAGGVRRRATEQFEGEVKITADKATNSLVVIASRRDYENLQRVVAELDRARKQVFVEIVVLEVSQEKSRELGLTFHGSQAQSIPGFDTNKPAVGVLGTRLGGINSLILDPSALLGIAFGLRGSELPNTAGIFGTTGIPSFGVLIRALQSNTDVDIISTPHILTTANEEATLQVGQNVPFIAGTTFTGASIAGVPPIRNIQRQDVALTLKLKPQVDEGDYIRMDFEQELTELAGNDPELGPTTTKRRIKTVVLARNQQTVVIGGLMRDKITYGTSKVPILGDIPLIGALFRVRQKSLEKRNLLVFLTPYVITKMEDFRNIFRQKMDERKQFLQLFHTEGHKSELWKYRNYERTYGFVEQVDMMLHRGEREAKKMQALQLQSAQESAKQAKQGGQTKPTSDKPVGKTSPNQQSPASAQPGSQKTTHP